MAEAVETPSETRPGGLSRLRGPLARILSAVLFLIVCAGLVWGAAFQAPRPDPWAPPDFWSWWLTPMPDALYAKMPVRPGGTSGGFVPAELCRDGDRGCPGLLHGADRGLLMFPVEALTAVPVHRLVVLSEQKRTIAISTAGVMFERQMPAGIWRPMFPSVVNRRPGTPSTGPTDENGSPVADQRGQQAQAVPGAQQQQQQQRPAVDRVADPPNLGDPKLASGSAPPASNAPASARPPTAQETTAQNRAAQALGGRGASGDPDTSSGGTTVSGGSGGGNYGDDDTAASVAVLTGYQVETIRLAISPDGRHAVTAPSDKTARIWDLTQQRQVGILSGHEGQVGSAAYNPDGTRIVTASEDRTARIWDPASGLQVARISGHENDVYSANYSPDGTRIVTAFSDQTALIWDATSGQQIAVLSGHRDVVSYATYSPGGQRIVTASNDRSARVWDATDGRSLLVLVGHESTVWAASYSPTGTQIVTASADGTAAIWDATDGRRIGLLKGPDGAIFAATYSPDGTRIVTASGDQTARIWDAATGQPIATLRGHTGPVIDAAYTPDGTHIVTTSFDATFRIWRPSERRPRITDLVAETDQSLWLAYRAAPPSRASTDLTTHTELRVAVPQDLHAATRIDPDHVVAVGAKGTILRFEPQATRALPDSPQAIASVKATNPGKRPPESADQDLHAIIRQGTQLWAAGAGGTILTSTDNGDTWTAQTSGTTATITGLHVHEPQAADSPPKAWAAARDADGRWIALHTANAATGPWHPIPHHPSPAWHLAFGFLLPLAGLLNIMAWQRPPALQRSIASQAAPERPIDWNDPDPLRFKPLAIGLSRFLRNASTEPPLTVAITGRWGSGKSSVMNLLADDIARHGGRPVRFNAWHHREEQHLLAALFENIRAQAIPPLFTWPGLSFRARLLVLRSQRLLWNLLAAAVFIGIALLVVNVGAPDGMDTARSLLLAELKDPLAKALDLFGPVASRAIAGLGGAGAAVAFLLWVRAKVAPLPAASKLLATLSRRASLADFEGQLGFRYHFGVALGEVAGLLRGRGSPGLVLLIDDLDRCQPDDVAKVLEAISFCVNAGSCIIVLGMDRRQVEFAVGQAFEKLVDGLPDDELDLPAGMEISPKDRQRAFARRYLEKLINLEVAVPSLEKDGLRRLLGADRSDSEPPLEAPIEDGPDWLPVLQTTLRAGWQVAQVMVLALVAGLMLLGGLQSIQTGPLPQTAAPSKQADTRTAGTPETRSAAEPGPIPATAPTARPFQPMPTELPVRRLSGSIATHEGRWLWWGPVLVLLAVSALWLVGAAARRRDSVVRDSPEFARALDAVEPLLLARNMTPRLVKRFQNRMRYLAERTRAQRPDTDWVAGLMHQIGRLCRRSLVPASWFTPAHPPLIPEEVLILLGAIEQAAPETFKAEPGVFFMKLASNAAVQQAWTDTETLYRASTPALAWPEPTHIRLYRDVVLPLLR